MVQREQGYAVDQSTQVIKAYYTLLNPLARAQYMVSSFWAKDLYSLPILSPF